MLRKLTWSLGVKPSVRLFATWAIKKVSSTLGKNPHDWFSTPNLGVSSGWRLMVGIGWWVGGGIRLSARRLMVWVSWWVDWGGLWVVGWRLRVDIWLNFCSAFCHLSNQLTWALGVKTAASRLRGGPWVLLTTSPRIIMLQISWIPSFLGHFCKFFTT